MCLYPPTLRGPLKHKFYTALCCGLLSCTAEPPPASNVPACTVDYMSPFRSGDELAALAPCEAVEGALVLTGLSRLPLLQLRTVRGSLLVEAAPSLTSLEGIGGLTTVDEILSISGNPSLLSLDDLENLTSVGKSFRIQRNESLRYLGGLHRLKSVGGLIIEGNDSLLDLAGPHELSSVGDLWIQRNESLRSVQGLASLTEVEGALLVQGNPTLTSLEGLSGIRTVGGSLGIMDNASLCQADVRRFAASIDVEGDLYLDDNGTAVAAPDGPCGGYYVVDNPRTLRDLAQLEHIPGDLKLDGQDWLQRPVLPALRTVGEDLSIENNPDLRSLEGFQRLTSVGDDFRIVNNPALRALSGLDGLRSVGGDLILDRNPSLGDLRALASLTTVGGTLYLLGAAPLKSLEGLEHLRTAGALGIFSDHLTSLAGLSGLTTVTGTLSVRCPAVPRLTGLGALTTAGFLVISGNHALTDLQGLSHLHTVEDRLNIVSNDSLTSLRGLSGLRVVGGRLGIWENASLTSLEGLDQLESVESLQITKNPSLCQDHARAFAATLEVSEVHIKDNDGPCP